MLLCHRISKYNVKQNFWSWPITFPKQVFIFHSWFSFLLELYLLPDSYELGISETISFFTASHFGEILTQEERINTTRSYLKADYAVKSPLQNIHVKLGLFHKPAARRSSTTAGSTTIHTWVWRSVNLFYMTHIPILQPVRMGLCCVPTASHHKTSLKSSAHQRTETSHLSKPVRTDLSFASWLMAPPSFRDCNHYFQVQGQMVVSRRKWCDFVVWTLQGISIERTYFDEQLWCSMLERLKAFYVEVVVPELYTSRVKRNKNLFWFRAFPVSDLFSFQFCNRIRPA